VSETTSSTPQSSRETAAVNWTQDGRLIAIETPLGKDKLLLTSLAGEEAISSLFAYELEMLSGDQAIQPESLIGRSVKIVITLKDGKTRPIHGMVAQFRAGPLVGRGLRQYSAQVVPWLWYLGQSSDCRIFQNLNVPDIIEQVFKTFGFTDYQLSVARGDYPKLEFCVQYRETALNFVSRLMEECGIFYFFRHEKERHLLVIADPNMKFNALPDPQLIYAPGNPQSGHVTQWENIYTFRPGRWSQRDFNFETPSNDLTTTEKTVLKLRNAETFERFDYPGLYTNKSLGGKVTRKLMEAEEAAYHAVVGASDYPYLDIGGKFTLASHPCEAESTAYVVRQVRHEATCASYLNQDGEPSRYNNTFQAIPNDVPFRPLRVTKKPFVQGPQTAVVTGPGGAEIFTDKYGRIKVQFHWDRKGKKDDKSSCWVRVAQSWAGRSFGTWYLPRIGQEVVVTFLEGDPDRPLVVGSVYNAEQTVPFALPANKTQSGLRTRSSLGGSGSNCNEFRFEDLKGSEMVLLHAEKDLTTGVEHDASHWVGHDETTTVDHDRTEHVKHDETITIDNNRTETVHANETITIDQNRTETVHANETITIDQNRAETVKMNETVTVVQNRAHTVVLNEALTVGVARAETVGLGGETITVAGARTISVGQNQSISVGQDQSIDVTGNETTSIHGDRSTSVTGGNETLDVKNTITISAGDDIVVKNKKASITIAASGDITIEGKQITIKGSDDVIIKGQKILQN
jgi:type VI secretion system secreted protein VgrG